MEPITTATVTTAWALAKTAGDMPKRLYAFGKSLKHRESKQNIDAMLDGLRELKQRASELEDENRELREQLRFKSDDYEFLPPFCYEKGKPERSLCPKCFANKVDAPMGAPGQNVSNAYRQCLVSGHNIPVAPLRR